jgi:hypothetical protein
MASTFTHRLDCALRMVDTTSGRAIPATQVHMFRQGREIFPPRKDGGFFLFMGTGPRELALDIEAEGYEPRALVLPLGDGTPLVRDVPMIPQPGELGADGFYTLSGTQKGLCAIDAVCDGDSVCLVRGYEKRRGILTITNPHRLELDMVFYAIVNPDEKTYEAIEIDRRISNETYRITPAPQKAIAAHFPLCRRVLGWVGKDGHYLLRLRRSAGRRWVVRTVTEGGECFEPADIQQPQVDSRSLEPP